MSDAQNPLKTRLIVMLAINAVAVIAVGAMLFVYLRMGQGWGLAGFIAAMLAGFGAQLWFILGLRGALGGANALHKEPPRGARVGKGA